MEKTAAVVMFNADLSVTYNDKKGNLHSMSPEGAVFKGGPAMVALRDHALDSALNKAGCGRYRAASDILTVAFPKVGKLMNALGDPWHDKVTFAMLLKLCERAAPGKNGWTKKQGEARMLVDALVQLPAFAPEALPKVEAVEAVEAVA